MDIKGFFLPTALSQLSTVKMGDVVSFSPLSGSPMLLVCLVVLILTCRLDYGDVFLELNVWRQWETNKMIRVIGCGHLEKGGNEWNSERKGVFSWKGACVLVKVLLRVEKKTYNESTGNGQKWTVQMAILVTELLCWLLLIVTVLYTCTLNKDFIE